MKAHFTIIIALVVFSSLNGQNRNYKELLVGTWVDGVSYVTDSAGNILEQERNYMNDDEPTIFKYDSIPTNLAFNSIGELFNFYNDEYRELVWMPSIYSMTGDTLTLGSRDYMISKVDEKELILREIGSLQWVGDFTFQKFTRENSDDFQSYSEKYFDGLKGDWLSEYIFQVNSIKSIWNDIPGVQVTDTLSKPASEPLFKFHFDGEIMSIDSENKSIPKESFTYTVISNYIIDRDGNGLFTIIDVDQNELTLLGFHALEMEGMPMMIWKLKRPKSQ